MRTTCIAVLGMALAVLSPALAGCSSSPPAPARSPDSYVLASAGAPTPVAEPPREAPAQGERQESSPAPAPEPGAPPPPAAPPPPPPPTQASPTSGANATPKGPAQAVAAPHQATMLIYTAHLTMAVYQTEPGLSAVERVAREVGGYLATRSDTEITIRVPRGVFDDAVRRIALAGDVVHKEVTAQDVTDEVVDLEIRLKNARNMRDRLAELLKRAAVKEALEIEKELGRVTEEVERLEGRLKLLSDKIAFSTITVTFAARGPGALRDMPLRLPFPWLSELGLPRLLSLHEGAP